MKLLSKDNITKKSLNNIIEASNAQSNLNRKTAKISVLPSGNLYKYDYLAGQDLVSIPGVIKQKQFEYSPLG